ncbi:hypothetical protein [Kineococcus sp. SYSU DK006]|uniref:hypothetical protein n=1 Tax=Kineococcus sp. SYSU DK006 TaxID=3383127 RepID=UPI003D7D87A6
MSTPAALRWAAAVLAAVAVLAGVVTVLQGDTSAGAWLMVAGGLVLSVSMERRRRERSAAATGDWPLQRVRELLAQAPEEGRVHQVRRLRRADRRLGLADAVALVEAAAREG